jgi:hypothetical protein
MLCLIALVFGVLNVLAVYRIGFIAYTHSQRYSKPAQEWWARGMFLVLLMWCLVSAFLGIELGKLATHAFHGKGSPATI